MVNNFMIDSSDVCNDFKAAGVAFTNGYHVLAGYQPHKKHPSISGIGGSRETDESYIQTGLRECIEELFAPQYIPKSLIPKLCTIIPKKVVKSNTYINIIYTFDDLQLMLKIIKHSGLKSPLYQIFPKTLNELIMYRVSHTSAEISHLALLPVISSISSTTFIDPMFVADMSNFRIKDDLIQ
jgi:hypothetical protein